MYLEIGLLIAALVVFLVAAFIAEASRGKLLAIGLALFAGAFLAAHVFGK